MGDMYLGINYSFTESVPVVCSLCIFDIIKEPYHGKTCFKPMGITKVL